MSMSFPNKLDGADDLAKFEQLAKLKHKQQFVWCLNALWEKGAEKDADQWFKWYHKFVEFDLQNRVDGCHLDELNAHRFYEFFQNTHTVKELRDKLREIGYQPRPMMFPFVVFACLEYKADWHYVVNAPQGSNEAELRAAQALLDAALAAADAAAQAAQAAEDAARAAQRAEAAAKAAADEARRREAAAKSAADAAKSAAQAAAQAAADAKKKAEESAARESELKAAQAEVEAALNEVKAQEEARERKTKDLTEKSQGTGVKAGMAKQELAQHLGADPLPLRKAKITLEAANRKATKAADAATAAREAADAAAAEAAQKAKEAAAAAKAAEAARAEAEEKAAEAEAARVEAEAKVAEAQAKLDEIKSQPGQAYGLIWWMERHLKYVQSFGRRK